MFLHCSSCKLVKPETAFTPRSEGGRGYRSSCKDCRSSAKRVYGPRRPPRPRQPRKEYMRQWRAEHPGYSSRTVAEWRKANPEKYRAGNIRDAASRRAARAEVPNFPIRTEQYGQKWEYWGGLCWMCGKEASAWDHVKPISKGGAHCLGNLRPACKVCNSRKGAKWPFSVHGEI